MRKKVHHRHERHIPPKQQLHTHQAGKQIRVPKQFTSTKKLLQLIIQTIFHELTLLDLQLGLDGVGRLKDGTRPLLQHSTSP